MTDLLLLSFPTSAPSPLEVVQAGRISQDAERPAHQALLIHIPE